VIVGFGKEEKKTEEEKKKKKKEEEKTQRGGTTQKARSVQRSRWRSRPRRKEAFPPSSAVSETSTPESSSTSEIDPLNQSR
ncbi:MAG: hypothetical protein ACPL6D_07030, partial [Thermodesulfobacteriota bacterium]